VYTAPVAPVVLDPTYSITTSSSTVAEGGVEVFKLTTKNIAPGTMLSYTITGTGNAAGNTSVGNFVIDASGTDAAAVLVPSNSVYGDSGTLVLSLNNGKATSATVTTTDSSANPALSAQNYVLTAGTDAVTGISTVANSISGLLGTGATVNSLDSITAAGSNNTLALADNTVNATDVLPTGITLSGVQNITLSTAGNAGTSTGYFDTTATGITGVTSLTVNSSSAGGDFIKAATTTAVSNTNTGSGSTITGGSSVTVRAKGAITVSGEVGAVTATNTAAGAAGLLSVTGGTNITATTADTGGVTVGGTGVNPTGAVVISDTNTGAGAITATGGTSVSVTAAGTDTITVGSATVAANEPTGAISITATSK
jgi:S-layer protein